ncbi:MAG: hypothetical protein ACXWU2_08395, partial [Allosphingosinicella sp.]
MADTTPAAEVAPPSRLTQMASRVRPSDSTARIFGVLLMVAIALGSVAAITYGILTSRTAYFEQRNLR